MKRGRPPKYKEKVRRISLSIPESLVNQAMGYPTGLSVSELVTRLLQDYFDSADDRSIVNFFDRTESGERK
jgi:hypothetical protein